MASIDFFQPFITSSIVILKKVARVTVNKKNVSIREGKVSVGGTGIVIDITGGTSGKVIFEFSRLFTMRISSTMIREAQIVVSSVKEYKELLQSALKELANMISGRALGILHSNGELVHISPPSIYLGKNVELVKKQTKVYIIDLISSFGDFSINLVLHGS